MVVFGQKWFCWGKVMFSVKVVVFGEKLFYWSKSACIRAKWFYSGKCGCNVVVIGKN